MRQIFPIERKIEIASEVQDEIESFTIQADIETWTDSWGEDADGNRGSAIIDSEIREIKVLDGLGNIVSDHKIAEKVTDQYNKFYAFRDQEKAEKEHTS